MSHNALTTRRLQLLANGYAIIPNLHKETRLPGWSDADYAARELHDRRRGVTSWARRFPNFNATGVRIENRLIAIDNDCDDEQLAGFFWEAVERHAPEVAERAPARYGGGTHKVMLFARLDADSEPFTRLWTFKYRRGEGGKDHRVEVFGGKPSLKGTCSKQAGIDGPHSFNEDGSVAREYRWGEGPTLLDTPIDALPVITRAQVAAIIDEVDRAAIAAGWERMIPPVEENVATVFDITGEMVFETQAGPLRYDELADGMRCSSSFTGDGGHNVTKCSVLWSTRHDCLGVYNHETTQWHYPAELKAADETALAQALAEVAVEQGLVVPMAEPDWRERYAESRAPKASFHNARLAIEALGLVCSEDVFHHRLLIGRGEAAGLGEPPAYIGRVTDASIGALRVLLSDTFGRDFTEKYIRDAVATMAHENRFDPVLDMLAEAEANWDGTPRLDRMAVDHFQCADTPFNRAAVRKTMIAAVARARVPGCKFDTIPVLEAPEGWNKSSAWLVLAGPENFSDESIIGKASREVQEALGAVWIHENAELAGMRKAEVEMVKAFASRQVDRARPAYGHFLIEQPRRSIEVGTTNSDEYLPSPTGNRRFWPLRLQRAIDLTKLRRERLQLWGEAAAAQAAGESLVLDEALWPEAGVEQEQRRTRHPWEAILGELTGAATGPELAGVGYLGNGVVHRVAGEDRVSTSAIFRHVLEMPKGQLNAGHAKTLADVMRALGWRTGVFRIDGRVVRGYLRTVVT